MFSKKHFSIRRSLITLFLAVCMGAAALAGSGISVSAASNTGAKTLTASGHAEETQIVTSYNKDYSFRISSYATSSSSSNNSVAIKLLGKKKGYENKPSMNVYVYGRSAKDTAESFKNYCSGNDTFNNVAEPVKKAVGQRTFYEITFNYKSGDSGIIDVLALSDGTCVSFIVRSEKGSGSFVSEQITSALDLAMSTFTLAETQKTQSSEGADTGKVSQKLISLAGNYLSGYEYVVNNILPNISQGTPGIIEIIKYGNGLFKFYKAYTAFKNYYSDSLNAAEKAYYRNASDSVTGDVLNRILGIINTWSKSLLWD